MTLTDQFHTDQDTKLMSQCGKSTVTERSKKGKEERKPVHLYLKGKRNKKKKTALFGLGAKFASVVHFSLVLGFLILQDVLGIKRGARY